MVWIIPDETAQEIATRQTISLLRHGEAGGPLSKQAWSVALLPEAGVFAWHNLNIYDVEGRLLFREKTLTLKGNLKMRMRTAASKFLGTPVWQASAGALVDYQASYTRAVEVAKENSLVPTPAEEAFVCYCYPKLGLLCKRQDTGVSFVVDLGDFSVIPVHRAMPPSSPDDVNVCWSPYDLVTNATASALTARWERDFAALPPVPTDPAALGAAVIAAKEKVEEKTVELDLKGQETPMYCAVAVAQMVLAYYAITKDQPAIAEVMHTSPTTGTETPDQVKGYDTLSNNSLTATYENNPSFDMARREVSEGRPVKDGIPGHARAIAGYRTSGGQTSLYIFDPWPVNKGQIYWEPWLAPGLTHVNYIYVRKTLYS